ncbi:hypothetical protein HYR82_02890 [Candidatus Peregrinibacteria bacterium]|nr:hypothetical protein [Candidatus Peregrinibacteria bacterium]
MPPVPVHDDGQNAALAEQLYDVLMAEIEPDLLLANIPTLDAKYAGESAEDHAARMKRYEAAYKAFDEEFAAFMADVNDQVRTSRRDSLKTNEEKDRTQEATALESLEAVFT